MWNIIYKYILRGNLFYSRSPIINQPEELQPEEPQPEELQPEELQPEEPQPEELRPEEPQQMKEGVHHNE